MRLDGIRRMVKGCVLAGAIVTIVAGGVNWVPAPRFAWAATPGAGAISDAGTEVSWSGSTLASAPVFSSGTCQTAQNCDVFSLVDEARHLLLTASAISSLTIEGARATFSGRGTLQDGTAVTFTVVATDNGNPGVGNDTFTISLSTGYAASGTLTGGNIKQH